MPERILPVLVGAGQTIDRPADPAAGREPLERSRTLPLWLSEWMRSRWTDAGRALAGMRPPPPSSSQSSQLFA